MKKSVSIPDELAYKVMDTVYVNRARDPKDSTSFSTVIKQALELFFNCQRTEVKK